MSQMFEVGDLVVAHPWLSINMTDFPAVKSVRRTPLIVLEVNVSEYGDPVIRVGNCLTLQPYGMPVVGQRVIEPAWYYAHSFELYES